MKGELYYSLNNNDLERAGNNETPRENEEFVWVADVNSGKALDKLDPEMEPTVQLATIVRDERGKIRRIMVHHQGVGQYDGSDSQYGRDDDYANGRIAIDGDRITGGLEGPLFIVKRNPTPQQKWIAKYGVGDSRDKQLRGDN